MNFVRRSGPVRAGPSLGESSRDRLPDPAHPAGATAFLAVASTLRPTGSRLRALPPVRAFSPSPAGVAGWRPTGEPPGELPHRPKWGRQSRDDARVAPRIEWAVDRVRGLPLSLGWRPEPPQGRATSVARCPAPRETAPRRLLRQRTGPSFVRSQVPLLRFTRRASTPGGCPPSESRCHPQFSFRPRGSSPPRRFPPRCGRRCLATGAGRGSPRFHGGSVPTRSVSRSGRGRRLPLPRDAHRTPRRTCDPSARAPVPHTRQSSRAASPRPLPPCRFHDFEALLRSVGLRSRHRRCQQRVDHSSFHGFCSPSRLSPPTAARRAPRGEHRDHPTACAASVRGERSRPLPVTGLLGVS